MAHVREVAQITHAHPLVHHICAIYVRILVELLRGGSVHDALRSASQMNVASGTTPLQAHVTALIQLSTETKLPVYFPVFEETELFQPDDTDHQGNISIAFVLGVHAVLHATSFEQGVCSVVERGGDTDTAGAIAGALLGARFGVHQMRVDRGLANTPTLRVFRQHVATGRTRECVEHKSPLGGHAEHRNPFAVEFTRGQRRTHDRTVSRKLPGDAIDRFHHEMSGSRTCPSVWKPSKRSTPSSKKHAACQRASWSRWMPTTTNRS